MQTEMGLEGGSRPRARRARLGQTRSRGEEREGQLALDLASPVPAKDAEPCIEPSMQRPDAAGPQCTDGEAPVRVERGRRGYLSGLAAEESVARHYARSGRVIVARRWRGPGGEIDLILREGRRLVFVEVKAARSFDAAIARIANRQIDRIRRSAEAFCGTVPDGQLTEMRFDLALVDGQGMVRVIEGAFDGD